MEVEVTTKLPNDPAERRRMQNRLAQRKFRQKKQQEAFVEQATRIPLVPLTLPPDENPPVNYPTPGALFAAGHTLLPPESLTTACASDLGDASIDFDTIDQWLLLENVPSVSSVPLLSIPSLGLPSSSSSATNLSPLHGSPRSGGDASRPSPDSSLQVSSDDGSAIDPIDPSLIQDKGWLGSLHIAAQKGHESIVRVLFQQGSMDPNSTDSDGRTPLFHAAIHDHESVVRLLLKNGARISLLDRESRSALHWAVLYRRLEVLRTLLEHWKEHEQAGFDINAYDNFGWTPLHLAVERGFELGVLLLMQSGADINAKAKKCPDTGKVIPFNVRPL